MVTYNTIQVVLLCTLTFEILLVVIVLVKSILNFILKNCKLKNCNGFDNFLKDFVFGSIAFGLILVVPVTITYEHANKQILKGKLENTSYGDIIGINTEKIIYVDELGVHNVNFEGPGILKKPALNKKLKKGTVKIEKYNSDYGSYTFVTYNIDRMR